MSDEIDRLLRTFEVGQRVRAALTIFYGTGEQVEEGELGTVHRVSRLLGVVPVLWDRLPGTEFQTSASSLDPFEGVEA